MRTHLYRSKSCNLTTLTKYSSGVLDTSIKANLKGGIISFQIDQTANQYPKHPTSQKIEGSVHNTKRGSISTIQATPGSTIDPLVHLSLVYFKDYTSFLSRYQSVWIQLFFSLQMSLATSLVRLVIEGFLLPAVGCLGLVSSQISVDETNLRGCS